MPFENLARAREVEKKNSGETVLLRNPPRGGGPLSWDFLFLKTELFAANPLSLFPWCGVRGRCCALLPLSRACVLCKPSAPYFRRLLLCLVGWRHG